MDIMMQFKPCRKQKMVLSLELQHYDVISCKQRHLIIKDIDTKGYQLATTTETLKKFPS